MVFGRPMLAQKRKHPERSREKEELDSKVTASQQELSPAWRMQQSIGNNASNQLLQHMPHTAPMISVVQGLPLHLQQFAFLIAAQAEQAHQQKLWKEFEQLTVGQRYALLMKWYVENEIIDDIPPNWKEWQEDITYMKHVQLQPEESKREANIALLGASQPQYDMNTLGLLVPYREAWIWLNYKGNKQGKADLLQRLDQLSVPQKQLLLHKLNGKGSLTLYQLSNVLTIEEHLKQWVDWDRIEQLLISVDRLNTEQVEQQLQIVQEEPSGGDMQSQSVQQSPLKEEEEDIDLFGLFLPDKQMPKVEELTLEQRLQNPEQLFQLLFGISLAEIRQNAVLGGKEQLIDRVLGIDDKLSLKQLEQERLRKLQEQGYASANQLFMLLKIIIIEILFDLGVKRKDEKYITILQKLELIKGKKAITKESIAARIHSI